MSQQSYMAAPWFALLQSACAASNRSLVATALAVSPPVISQVLNGTGKYGAGTAGTDKLAARVLHTFGRYACPHLTEQHGETTVISADECRAYAHRPAPAASPRDMQHWQACLQCSHKGHTAPAIPRESKPRGGRVLHIVPKE